MATLVIVAIATSNGKRFKITILCLKTQNFCISSKNNVFLRNTSQMVFLLNIWKCIGILWKNKSWLLCCCQKILHFPFFFCFFFFYCNIHCSTSFLIIIASNKQCGAMKTFDTFSHNYEKMMGFYFFLFLSNVVNKLHFQDLV